MLTRPRYIKSPSVQMLERLELEAYRREHPTIPESAVVPTTTPQTDLPDVLSATCSSKDTRLNESIRWADRSTRAVPTMWPDVSGRWDR